MVIPSLLAGEKPYKCSWEGCEWRFARCMSPQGTTGNTQVQSPLNATTATGKEMQKLVGRERETVKWVGGWVGRALPGFITSLSQETRAWGCLVLLHGETNEIKGASFAYIQEMIRILRSVT